MLFPQFPLTFGSFYNQPTYFKIPNTNIIFIANPKAANSSILKALSVFIDNCDEHSTVQTRFLPYKISSKDTVADLKNDHFVFSVVRNSWDRVLSHYFDKVNNSVCCHTRLTKYGFFHKMSFHDYLEIIYEKYYIINDVHIKNQLELLFSSKKCFLPNFIIRYEELVSDFEILKSYIMSNYSKNISLDWVNRSSRPIASSSIYCPNTIKLVSDIYKNDIEFFNFSPPLISRP
jgi:hypothetical protein